MKSRNLLLCALFLYASLGNLNAAPLDSKEEKTKNIYPTLQTKAVKDAGMFTHYEMDGKHYFAIPDSLFGREMLFVTRRAKSTMDMGFGGELMDERIFTWENRDGQTIDLCAKSFRKIADKDSEMYGSVETCMYPTIIKSLSIVGNTPDSSRIIDVTELFRKDDLAFGLDTKDKKDYALGNLEDKSSYIETIKSFPTNIEVSTVKTYNLAGQGRVVENEGLKKATMVIHNSLLLLPEKPMMPRYADERVGFFSRNQWDYGFDDAQRSVRTSYIKRWRLEPKDEEAFRRGELVEPVKPIVYYLSPNIPQQWVPYFIKGVEAWQAAFEQAGFKNAIQARVMPTPEEDPDFDPLDARYSVIEYFASYVENSYGPHVSDPRSGEIIESHVCIFHNVMKLVHDWYMVQCGAQDPEARKMVFSTELMGRLVQYIVTHEVGHTLGLAHNFASSHAFPVDSLRSASFTQKYGTTPSVMDYARFNYVAQPEDKGVYLFPKLGDYDRYAIEWGYRPILDAKTPEDERLILNDYVKAHADDPRFKYIRQFIIQFDPRGQTEDLGDDAVKASEYGMKNLKIVLDNLDKWTWQEGHNNDDLAEMYDKSVQQWVKYLRHVSTYLGGVYEDYKTADQPGDVFRAVEKEKQKEALKFLGKYAINTPKWLIDQPYINRFNSLMMNTRHLQEHQAKVVHKMLNVGVILRLSDNYAADPKNGYNPVEYLEDVNQEVWADLYGKANSDLTRRVLQRTYIEDCEDLLNWKSANKARLSLTNFEFVTLIRHNLIRLEKQIDRRGNRTSDPILRQHYLDSSRKIHELLYPGNNE